MKWGEKIALFAGSAFLIFELVSQLAVQPKYEKEVVLRTADSLNAYSPVDSNLKKADSMLKKDSGRLAALLPNHISTREVSPQELVNFAKTLIGTPYLYA